MHTGTIQSRNALAPAQRVALLHARTISPRHPPWLVPVCIRARMARAGGILADIVVATGVAVKVTILDGAKT